MSSEPLDLRQMTVEDLFRAKRERRKRLAALPFEEKIAIVKKLQSVSAAIMGEKPIFATFLKVCPDFAGEPIEEWDVVDEWYRKRELSAPLPPYDKRPDIISRTVSGKMIGVELKSWLNEPQIAEARRRPANQWVQSPSLVGFYGDEMLETLNKCLIAYRSDHRYQNLGKHVGLDEVYLLIHYDFKAFAYNTPFDAPNFGFREAAEFASSALNGDGGYFDRIFLFHFLWGKEEAYRIL